MLRVGNARVARTPAFDLVRNQRRSFERSSWNFEDFRVRDFVPRLTWIYNLKPMVWIARLRIGIPIKGGQDAMRRVASDILHSLHRRFKADKMRGGARKEQVHIITFSLCTVYKHFNL